MAIMQVQVENVRNGFRARVLDQDLSAEAPTEEGALADLLRAMLEMQGIAVHLTTKIHPVKGW